MIRKRYKQKLESDYGSWQQQPVIEKAIEKSYRTWYKGETYRYRSTKCAKSGLL